MTEVQPMKMAAAEALYGSVPAGVGAPFSVLTVGSLDGSHANAIIEIPGLLSFLATGDVKAAVKGINDLKAQYAQNAYDAVSRSVGAVSPCRGEDSCHRRADPIVRKVTGHRSRELERYQHLTPELRALTVN